MAEFREYSTEDAQVAAQMEANVGVVHIADVYAKALLGTSEKAGQTSEVLAELDELVKGVLARFPKLDDILASARISYEEKAGILDRVLGQHVSPMLLHFLKVVARHGRLDYLRAIHVRAHAAYDTLRGRIDVQLTTATPINDEMAQRIADQLRSALGGEPVLRRITDPNLIGGAVLRIGDTVHDASIARQLQTIREQISDRSAHEIQSRRDRFRYPAGN
jgi:F-type H+-transporting ATPase subunit delta